LGMEEEVTKEVKKMRENLQKFMEAWRSMTK
jgi:hypothetical protein